MPRRPALNGCDSSAVPCGSAGPTAPALEVWTTRTTPALSASSITLRVPPTFTSNTLSRSRFRIEVVPATWKTFSTPSIAARTDSRSVTSPPARSNSNSSRWDASRPSRISSLNSSPRSASCLTTCEPMKPVPPVTSVGAIGGHGRTPVVSASTRPALVSDTTSYLPAELIEMHDISQVSLYVGLEGQQEPEIDLLNDLDGFYERLKASDEAVTTSQPSVGDFIAVYEPLLAADRDIVSIHISAGISGTYDTAVQARDRLSSEGKAGERIHIVDSRTAAGGMAMVVLAAASAAEQGESAEGIAARAAEARAHLKLWFAVDTLEYLRRGGRIGTAGAWIGTTLKIKPILTFEEEVTPVERVRTRARSIERLVDYATQRHEDGADAWVVNHIQVPEAAASLVESCRSVFECEPTVVAEMGPVVGAHAGPGLLGIGATTHAALGLE